MHPSSALPTTVRPTAIPSTVEYYISHPKATLPSNESISVIGPSNLLFKITLSYLTMSSGPYGAAFSDIVLSTVDTTSVLHEIPSSALLSPTTIVGWRSFGSSMAYDTSKRSASILGDVNGDDFDDLIIGDPYKARCYVLYGSVTGFLNLTRGFTIFGEQEGDMTGWSVNDAGDVNNDTIADIIVGAPNARGVGAVYVLFGRTSDVFDIYLSNLTISEGFAVYGAVKSDYLGIAVSAVNDVNGDRCDDVIVGAVLTSAYLSGAAHVIYGCKITAVTITTAEISSDQGFKIAGPSYSYLGYTVSAAGDVNKDGKSDVLIGNNPQRASVPPAVFIVFGASRLDAIDTSTLGTEQGLQVMLENEASFLARRDDSLLIGGAVGTSSGTIHYLNTSFMVPLNHIPTMVPSVAPTLVPSRSPVRPTVTPTRMPSVRPSFVPTSPTVVPTVGASAPTLWPTSLPTSPTLLPTELPTEAPTQPPSESPSEPPSHKPSESPSEHPSMKPSVGPTVEPMIIVTATPSIESTGIGLTRSPFSIPTAGPSAQSSIIEYTSYYIDGTTTASINQSASHVNYIVNTTDNVTINNPLGFKKFTIFPNAASALTIVNMNASNDVIDLTAFVEITQLKQLTISDGSVIIALPRRQIIHILNLHPSDISAANFDFYPASSQKHKDKPTKPLSLAAACLIAIGGLILGSLILFQLCGNVIRLTMPTVLTEDRFLMELKYNKHGDLIGIDNDDLESSGDIEEGSALLSDFTLNSEGEFNYKGDEYLDEPEAPPS